MSALGKLKNVLMAARAASEAAPVVQQSAAETARLARAVKNRQPLELQSYLNSAISRYDPVSDVSVLGGRGRAGILADIVGSADEGLKKALMSSRQGDKYTPEALMSNYDELVASPEKSIANLPAAWRWESRGRELYDPGVVHYDVSGGSALPSIIKNQKIYLGEELGVSERELENAVKNIFSKGQIRVGALRDIESSNAVYSPYDLFAGSRSPDLGGKVMFYPNQYEGLTSGALNAPSNVRVVDILNDPALRRELNLSAAVPGNHPLHKRSMVFKARGGLAQIKECSCGRK